MSITLTREEFNQRYGNQSPVNTTISKEEFNKMYGIDDRSTTRKVGDFFTSSTQKFGKTLGTAASVVDPATSRDRDATLKASVEAESNIQRLIVQARTQEPEQAKRTMDKVAMLSKENSVDIFSNPEYQKTAKQVYGEGLGTLLETLQFSSFGSKGLQTGKLGKELPTVIKPFASTIKQGVKTGAKYGGTFGAGFGVADALEEDKSGVDIAKAGLTQGAIGVGAGGVLGGGISTLAGGLSKLTAQTSKLVPVVRKTIGDKAYNKLLSVSRDLIKMSPTQSRNEIKWNKNTPKFLVEEGVVNKIGSDGKRIVTDDAVKALQEKYYAESRAFNKLLTDSGEYVSLNDFKRKALATIDDKFKARGSDYTKALKQIVEEVDAYKNNYRKSGLVNGDDVLVNISDFNRIKSGLWSKTSNFNPSQSDKLLSDINYKMGQTAKTLIEDTVEDVAVKQMNSRLGDMASAIDVLQKANNKVLPGGFFGKAFTRIAGSIVGSSGGVPGTLIGNLSGGMLADVMMNPQYKTGALLKFLKLLKKQNPKAQSIIDDAHAILQERKADRAVRRLLTQGDTIAVGPKTDTSRLLTQEEAREFLKGTGTIKNKSGEMFGVVAGLEIDENGNVSFSPEKAMLGMMVMGMTSKSAQIKSLQQSFDNLSKRISKISNKTVIKQLEKAKKEISDLMWKIRNDDGGFAKLPGETPSTISDDIAKDVPVEKLREINNVSVDVVEQSKKLTKTPEFKNWFGKSKVVESNGEPKVLYHGTADDIIEFDKMRSGETTANNEFDAFWFTSEPDVARDYSQQAFIRKFEDSLDDVDYDPEKFTQFKEIGKKYGYKNADKNVLHDIANEQEKTVKAYVKMENPLVIDQDMANRLGIYKTSDRIGNNVLDLEKSQGVVGFAKGERGGLADDLVIELLENDPKEFYKMMTDFDESMIKDYKDEIVDYIKNEVGEEMVNKDLIKQYAPEYLDQAGILSKKEFDGVVFKDVIDSISEKSNILQDVYVVFEPNQIKAVNNRGTFSDFDRNIFYGLGAGVVGAGVASQQ